jgi:hypothetical protein
MHKRRSRARARHTATAYGHFESDRACGHEIETGIGKLFFLCCRCGVTEFEAKDGSGEDQSLCLVLTSQALT